MPGVPSPQLRSGSVLTRSSLLFGTLVAAYALVTIASLLHHANHMVFLDSAALTVLEVLEHVEVGQTLGLPVPPAMGSVRGSVSQEADTDKTSIDEHVGQTLPLQRRPAIDMGSGSGSVSQEAETDNTSKDEEFMASCLMVMDDNHRLVEWISYHYFVMNLRYLVVHPDPNSVVSPKPVLDRWREYMTIVEWSEEDFMGEEQSKKMLKLLKKRRGPIEQAQKKHNFRQNTFYRQCALHMKEKDRTWVSFHDVDEYYVINSDLVKDSDRRMRQLGGGLKLLTQQVQSTESNNSTMIDHYIDHHYSGPCITAYRTQYGARKSSKTEEESKRHVPKFLDALRFETLRWRNHEPHTHPQDGKSLLDVSKIDVDMLQSEDSFTRPHELLPTCPTIFYHPRAFLRINHYIGSWSYYSFRQNDGRQGARKTHHKWESESAVRGGTSGDEIRPWIQGFVNLMGEEKAKSLLEGVGLDPNYKAPVPDSWMRRIDRGSKAL
jgi:hypothetical protein